MIKNEAGGKSGKKSEREAVRVLSPAARQRRPDSENFTALLLIQVYVKKPHLTSVHGLSRLPLSGQKAWEWEENLFALSLNLPVLMIT